MKDNWRNRDANAMFLFVPVAEYRLLWYCFVTPAMFPAEGTVRRAHALLAYLFSCFVVSCLLTVTRVED